MKHNLNLDCLLPTVLCRLTRLVSSLDWLVGNWDDDPGVVGFSYQCRSHCIGRLKTLTVNLTYAYKAYLSMSMWKMRYTNKTM